MRYVWLVLLAACGEPGAFDFDRPTDVAIAADDSFYVSDGYGNCRIQHFDVDGTLLRSWGQCGDDEGQFDTPHGLALDSEGRVYVADRGNARVQLFSADGSFLSEWRGPDVGRPYGVAVDGPGNVFLVDGGDQIDGHGRGFVTRHGSDGALETRWGDFGSEAGRFLLAHDVAVGPNGDVYVADIQGKRVTKFRRR